ncbi:MAG TPA: VWA domain-containing protein [Pyrinomonadaceae bacterium]|jgi:von Willebrand factor type A domain.|nr:VWA domain-containing protein [Pyrinomonadaceae bacterium]
MKKYVVLTLLFSLLLITAIANQAQTRPRRAVQPDASGDTKASPPQPGPDRPVLRGAYPDGQKPTDSKTAEPAGPQEVEAGDIIRVDTTLVTIPVSVMDRDGRYVPNLRKEDFRLWEEGVEQDVAFFSSVDKPFSVVLMLDTSPSTQFRLEDIQEAAISFVNQLRPDDRVMVVSFNGEINVLSDFTSDRSKLDRAIRRAHTDDGTRLYDAVDAVINRELSRVQGRKAIVLFTDGVDTTSRRATYESNLQDAQELDALIYSVQYDTSADVAGVTFPGQNDVFGQILGGIFGGGRRGGYPRGGGGYPRGGGGYPRGTGRSDYELADQYLREIANNTGGRQYHADSLQNMSLAFANVAEELRRQYSIGYYPKRPGQPGERRQIKVRANEPNLAVRSRDSYVVNSPGTSVANGNRQNPPVLRKLTPERPSTKF